MNLYQICDDIIGLRAWVRQNFNITTHDISGLASKSINQNYYLPIVLTARGPLYAEVIKQEADSYSMPFHLSDIQRQLLYRLAWKLLEKIQATPATYFLQFQMLDDQIIFDRLWPYLIPAAIASVGVQEPDLFTCHGYCLLSKPILDLKIRKSTS